MGLVNGKVKLTAISESLIAVIQGEKDKYGSPAVIMEAVKKTSPTAKVLSIANADHSYRNDSKEPVYQSEAISMLVKELILVADDY